MLPLRDNVRSHTFPLVNWALIAVNTLVFLYQTSLPLASLERLVMTMGLVPASLDAKAPLTLVPIFSSMFLHGGWFHFLSNMWTLYIFGDNIEDRMGAARYLLFYISGGIVANLLNVFVFPDSQVVTIGASGAIAGVLGGYFLLYPRAMVITLIPLFIIPSLVNIPAVIFLGFWFVSQLFSGFLSLATPTGASLGGIAWWAHIGGFLYGLLLVRLFSHRHPTYYHIYPDEYWPY